MFKDLLSTIETIFSMDNEYFVLVIRTILLIVVLKLISKFDIVKIYDNSKNFRILYQRIETEVKLCKKDIPQWVQSIIIQDKVN